MIDHTPLKTQLEAKLAEVTSELETIAYLNETSGDWEALPDSASNESADENATADGAEEWEERQATVGELETIFRNIARALAKIEEGTYGICEVCQAPIQPDRLVILPTARTCTTHMDDERTLSL